MPVIFINMREGKSTETKRELLHHITEVVSRDLEVPKEKITIFINERTTTNICIGGNLACDN